MNVPRKARFLFVLVASGVALGAIGGVTYGAFFSTTSNSGNSFSAAADWVAPTASASVIAKQTGYLAGKVKQGGTYYVYANATDSGNPASGVSTITADVSNVTTGATSVALTSAGGPFSAEGVSYTYRSALQTASNPLAAGVKTYTLTLTDVAGNSQTQSGFSVTVDNTAPTALDVQTVNGGVAGTPDNGDTILLTYSDQLDPQSILAGWTGGPLTVTVRINNGGGGNDTVQIWDSANATRMNFGSINLGRTDYVTASRTFTSSSLTVAGGVYTIVMNGGLAGASAGGTGNMNWAPSALAYDAAGNNCSGVAASESGAADMDF